MAVSNTTSNIYSRMNFQYKEYEAKMSLKAVQRELTEALSIMSRPHMYGTALFSINAAMRRLATAQWRLMQAKEEYNREKNGLDKS